MGHVERGELDVVVEPRNLDVDQRRAGSAQRVQRRRHDLIDRCRVAVRIVAEGRAHDADGDPFERARIQRRGVILRSGYRCRRGPGIGGVEARQGYRVLRAEDAEYNRTEGRGTLLGDVGLGITAIDVTP